MNIHYLVLAAVGLLPMLAHAAPDCPPRYSNICQQLIKALEDSNDGQHGYSWDGEHLLINKNFEVYSVVNNSATDLSGKGLAFDPWDAGFGRNAFNEMLGHVVSASQGGRTVYLHFFHGWGTTSSAYTTSSLSNAPLAPPVPVPVPVPVVPVAPQQITQAVPSLAPPMPVVTPQLVPSPVPQPVPQPVPAKVPQAVPSLAPPMPVVTPQLVPNPVPQPVPQPTPAKTPQTVPSVARTVPQPVPSTVRPLANKPVAVSVTYNVKSHAGHEVGKDNVNWHFATTTPGSHLEQEERAYLVDSSSAVWSCKVSGLGARAKPTAETVAMNEPTLTGHVETLQFRSIHLAHIPGNHPMHTGCLISVEQ